MSDECHVPLYLCVILLTVVLLTHTSEAVSFKGGRVNVTTVSPGYFACEQVSFAEPFHDGSEIKVFASFGYSVKNPRRGNGAAVWVESEDKSHFKTCISEYSSGSNKTGEVNWIAVQSVPSETQIGSTILKDWTTGTECKMIDFPRPFLSPPTIIVTPSHLVPDRSQDAMAYWLEGQSESSFKICYRETKIFGGLHQNIKMNWLAFSKLSIENSTLAGSLVFASNNSPSQQDNFAFCQKMNFTDPFFAPPVLVVTPKCSYNQNNSRLSGSAGCNAVITWVEHTSTTETEICVKTYNSAANNKDTVKVDYLVIGEYIPTQGGLGSSGEAEEPEGSTGGVEWWSGYHSGEKELLTDSDDDGYEEEGENEREEEQEKEDLDECTTNTDDCDNNAACQNTVGSYTCTCKAGLVGDGKTCYVFSMASTIIANNTVYQGYLAKFLAPAVGNHSKWLLCYRASSHGWNVNNFHSRCDGKNHTVTIIKVGNYTFGGYTDTAWESSDGCGGTSNAFIFSLRNKEGFGPFLSLVEEEVLAPCAIDRRSNRGPTFGSGPDIYIANNANSVLGNKRSFTYLHQSYMVPSGVKDPHTILAGTFFFTPDDYEVFYLA